MNRIEGDVQRQALLGRAVDTLLRCALLRVARDGSNLQDRIDCAELALAAGEPEAARTLYAMIFLRMGFAADSVADQRAMAAQSGLWSNQDLPELRPGPALPSFSVDRAIAELAELIRVAPLAESASILDPVIVAPSRGDINRPVSSAAEGGLDPKEHVQAPVPRLAAIVAMSDLQLFLRENYGLAFGPGGSPRLMHAAAQLSRGGLGPYFTNVGNIVRDARDLFGLVAAAAPHRQTPAHDIGIWTVLLASHLEHQQLLDYVDELADRGMGSSLWGIFQARARRMSIWRDYGLLQRLRDGALDLGDWPLAIRAQEMIVHVAQYDPGELNVLGTILANAREMERAEQVFADYAARAPGDKTLASRLAALRAGEPTAFEITGGLCTPPQRKHMRMALWQPEVAARLAVEAA
jgi:hypothetical protein